MVVMAPQHVISSTHELASPVDATRSEISLVPGPVWTSFEKFRAGGVTVLDAIPPAGVGTLRSKTATYRILRDADFQRLVGWASDAYRLHKGVKLVVQAAKIVVKHPEMESLQLLIDSASLIAESPGLPMKQGHDSILFSQSELDEQSKDDFDLATTEVPRPW